MTEAESDNFSPARRYASIGLVLLAIVALGVFLLLLRQWQAGQTNSTSVVAVAPDKPAKLEMSKRLTQPGAGGSAPGRKSGSMLLPLLAFSVTLGVGACVGRFWPQDGDEAEVNDEASFEPTPAQANIAAEVDEADDALFVEAPMTTTAMPTRTIDDLPLDEALAAKDEVIESLENIVKENRDRWSNFESERDELNEKIRNLNAELRIASDIIEGLHGDADDVTYRPPQVLGRA